LLPLDAPCCPWPSLSSVMRPTAYTPPLPPGPEEVEVAKLIVDMLPLHTASPPSCSRGSAARLGRDHTVAPSGVRRRIAPPIPQSKIGGGRGGSGHPEELDEFDNVLFESVPFEVVFSAVQGTGVVEVNIDVEEDGFAPLAS
jgi:hypothetical protein